MRTPIPSAHPHPPDGPAPPPRWSAADLLSLSRVGLAIVVWFLPRRPEAVLATMVVAALTDVVDGRVARHAFAARTRQAATQRTPDRPALAHRPATTGDWLDPVCDKVFVVSAVCYLAVAYRLPLPWLAVLALREILLVPIVALLVLTRPRGHVDLRAAPIGKVTTVLQFLALVALLWRHPAGVVLSIASGAAGLAAVVWYLARASGHGQLRSPPPSVPLGA